MTDEPRPIATPAAPRAIGPYSQAVVAGGFVHCSGQIALDPETGEMIEGDVRAQAEQVLANLKNVLEAAGSSMSRVAKCNVYLAYMDDFGTVNEVYEHHFGGPTPPARATVQVAHLPKDALVEIDCLALA